MAPGPAHPEHEPVEPDDLGDAEVANAEAAIEGRPSAAGPPDAMPPVEAIAIPPVEAIAIPLCGTDIKVPQIKAGDGDKLDGRKRRLQGSARPRADGIRSIASARVPGIRERLRPRPGSPRPSSTAPGTTEYPDPGGRTCNRTRPPARA